MPSRRPLRIALAAAIGGSLLGILPIVPAAAATTFTVTTSAASGVGSLEWTLAQVSSGDTIVFADGVTTIVLDHGIGLIRGITIDGGGDVVLARTGSQNFTQISIHPGGSNQDFTLKDLTIAGAAGSTGSAILADYGLGGHHPRNITMSGVIIRDQVAPYRAIGELIDVAGTVRIEDSVFENNRSTEAAAGYEGGLYVHEPAAVSVARSEFRGNSAATSGGVFALFGDDAAVEIVDSVFEDNSAGEHGGALYVSCRPRRCNTLSPRGSVVIAGSSFIGNSGQGGAVYSDARPTLTVTDSTFVENGWSTLVSEATTAGVHISGSTFRSNDGGAIRVHGSPLEVRSTGFYDNRVGPGVVIAIGAMENRAVLDSITISGTEFVGSGAPTATSIFASSGVEAGSMTITNSTIDEDEDAAPAIHIDTPVAPLTIGNSTIVAPRIRLAAIGATLTVTNSILDTELEMLVGQEGDATVSHSLITEPLPAGAIDGGGNRLVGDPRLAALADNGGPTLTRLPAGDSPAIGRGTAVDLPAYDQRGVGFPRVRQGLVDIGAVETDATPTPDPEPSPVYRFWSSTKRSHFYTADPAERDFVIEHYDDTEWASEGVAYEAFLDQEPGTIPLYRFWSHRFQGHFYTASESEKDAVIADYPDDVWEFEGVAYYVYPDAEEAGAQVFRFWSAQNRHHFYTADPAERDYIVAHYPSTEWAYEGPAFGVPD